MIKHSRSGSGQTARVLTRPKTGKSGARLLLAPVVDSKAFQYDVTPEILCSSIEQSTESAPLQRLGPDRESAHDPVPCFFNRSRNVSTLYKLERFHWPDNAVRNRSGSERRLSFGVCVIPKSGRLFSAYLPKAVVSWR